MNEEPTSFLRKTNPVLLAIVEVIMKRFETIITNLLTAIIVIWFEQSHVHKQIWQETGQHFQDIVQTNTLLATEIKQKEKHDTSTNSH